MASRTVAESIAILFSYAIVAVLLINPILILILELTTDQDTTGLIETEREILQVIVGALIGFIAGRGEAAYQSSKERNEPSS